MLWNKNSQQKVDEENTRQEELNIYVDPTFKYNLIHIKSFSFHYPLKACYHGLAYTS